jgi:hypothetical protein
VDRSAPTIALSGSLYDHRDRPLTESDSYSLHVRALEPSCATDGQRSGVANIEIQVDGTTRGEYELSSVGRCLYEADWTYRPSDYGPGEHVVTTTVTDQAGNRRVRHLRPIYVGPDAAGAQEPVQGLAAAAGLADEDLEAIPSPKPDLLPIWRGDVLAGKGYFGSGLTQPRVAVGGGRVYVTSGGAGIKSFDLADPAGQPVQTVTTTPAPGGIAHYRDELYAVADKRIDVYRDGSRVRSLGLGPCHDGTLGELEQTANQAGCNAAGLGLKRPQGIDAAWGKLFVADEATDTNARIVRTYATDTGVPLGLSPNGDPDGAYRDLSVAPDQDLYFDGRRANTWLAGATIPWLNTGPLLDGHEPGTLPPTGAADTDWCDCPGLRGTDWVWGMNWLLATTTNGTRIEEYGPSVRKRTWTPKQTNGSVSDVAYHKREERLEATGDLLRHDWVNHDQQLLRRQRRRHLRRRQPGRALVRTSPQLQLPRAQDRRGQPALLRQRRPRSHDQHPPRRHPHPRHPPAQQRRPHARTHRPLHQPPTAHGREQCSADRSHTAKRHLGKCGSPHELVVNGGSITMPPAQR